MKKILGKIVITTLLSLFVVQQTGFAMEKQESAAEEQSGNKTRKQKKRTHHEITNDTTRQMLDALNEIEREDTLDTTPTKKLDNDDWENMLFDVVLPRLLADANKKFEQESTTERARLAEIEKTLLELEQKIQTRSVCNKIKQLSEEKAALESKLKKCKNEYDFGVCNACSMMLKADRDK